MKINISPIRLQNLLTKASERGARLALGKLNNQPKQQAAAQAKPKPQGTITGARPVYQQLLSNGVFSIRWSSGNTTYQAYPVAGLQTLDTRPGHATTAK